MAHVLGVDAVGNIDEYRTSGGGRALDRCDQLGADGVIAEIRSAGLRGRGGAGFPTGFKWSGLAADDAATKFVVCNGAEGEPGTFKDRAILRRNPYQVIEGLAVAAYATGASKMFLGIKSKLPDVALRVERAAAELSAEGLLGDIELVIVQGPDDYLFGEEKALLEVIEGRDPLPRLFPPYVQGLFEGPNQNRQPAAVNNVETLANVPHILGNGATWFRSMGTDDSPGTMVCTVGGDTAVEAVAEIELGTPLRVLVDDVGGGTSSGAPIHLVMNGVSNAPLTASDLDVPISFEGMANAGSGLGSAGFTVFDTTACAARIALAASAFLYRGSCGQCPPCKLGTGAITERFASIVMGAGQLQDVREIAAWVIRVTDANRCGLGAGQRALARGILDNYPEDIAHHLDGDGCPSGRTVSVTTIEDWIESEGRFIYSAPVLEDAPGG